MSKRFVMLLVLFTFIVPQVNTAAEVMLSCGPAGKLDSNFSSNVDSGSRCFEIRMYTAAPKTSDGVGGIDNLHERFREKEIAIFKRLGAEVVAVWQRLDNPNTLVWMLAYKDGKHRTKVWNEFRSDPEWLALSQKYPVALSAEVYMMSATDYSKLK